MDGAFDIPDPTDWLETPLKDFAPLENAIHCDICKEFYDTPMITSCCHTFCSKCIRTCLSANGKCPSCQTADQASKLRNNWVLQTIVEQFLEARPAALDVARREQHVAEQGKRPGKRKRVVLDSDDVAEAEQHGRMTRGKSRRIAASQTSELETIEIEDSDADDAYVPEREPDDGLVECLFGCGKRIKPDDMNAHLDRCEQEKQQEKQAARAESRTPVNSLGSRLQSAHERKAPERISEFNYSLLNDRKLRQKLEDAGIPNWGARQLVIKRHTEWVNLWNANCDSGGKKTQRDLLRDLDSWERTQGGKAPNANGMSSSVMRKDFDGAGWANNNRSDFSRLIADAKRKKSNPATEDPVTKAVDMADAELQYEHPEVQASGENDLRAQDSPQPKRDDADSHEPNDPARPYEDNQEALSSIRDKVEAANSGELIEPKINAGFEPRSAKTENAGTLQEFAAPAAEHEALLQRSHWGTTTRDEHALAQKTSEPCDLQIHLSSSPVKVPMFAVPARPFSDVDGGNADVGGR